MRFVEWARGRRAEAGVSTDEDMDIYTALVAGLADQQAANDPVGERWLRLVDEVIDTFFDEWRPAATARPGSDAGGRGHRSA